MDWAAEALILGVRKHGESGAILDVLAREQGRYGGYVHGGNSRRMRPIAQIGNMAHVTWRARLSEHLGTMTLEASRPFAAEAMEEPRQLAALTALCAMLQILPERQAAPPLFDKARLVLDALCDGAAWPPAYVRFEMALLTEMGFGLDLTACAATGAAADLTHVSPRSGRAVSRAAAAPYAERLFALPRFLQGDALPTPQDVSDGLRITAHFLEKWLYAPDGLALPPARARLMRLFAA